MLISELCPNLSWVICPLQYDLLAWCLEIYDITGGKMLFRHRVMAEDSMLELACRWIGIELPLKIMPTHITAKKNQKLTSELHFFGNYDESY